MSIDYVNNNSESHNSSAIMRPSFVDVESADSFESSSTLILNKRPKKDDANLVSVDREELV